jgi:hypothetical protein
MSDDREAFDGWFEGVLPPGVRFAPEQAVVVTGGPQAGKKGSVLSLTCMGEDPAFIVEFEDGSDDEVPQSQLQSG